MIKNGCCYATNPDRIVRKEYANRGLLLQEFYPCDGEKEGGEKDYHCMYCTCLHIFQEGEKSWVEILGVAM
jgi:hypothetical protein